MAPAPRTAGALSVVPQNSQNSDKNEEEIRPWRGYERLKLIRDLALQEFSYRELAEQNRVQKIDIQNFAEDYAQEISEYRAALQGDLPLETAGMWITKKPNRLAEYEHEAEEIRDGLQRMRDNGIFWSRAHRDMIRSYIELLRAVADELGAYPQRQSSPATTGSTVHYIIDTEDTDKLT